jgi:Ferric reductase like transmembrane component
MTAIELSSYFGLAAMTLLTFTILIGLVMAVKYNPVRSWPHRRINTFKIHNWTAYIALTIASIHPLIILFSSTAKFTFLDILFPVNAPKQPWINVLGALSLYSLVFVVLTSLLQARARTKEVEDAALHGICDGGTLLRPRGSHRPDAQGRADRLLRRREDLRRAMHPARDRGDRIQSAVAAWTTASACASAQARGR